MDSITFVVFVVPVSIAALGLIGLIAGLIIKRIDDREDAEERAEEEAARQLAAHQLVGDEAARNQAP